MKKKLLVGILLLVIGGTLGFAGSFLFFGSDELSESELSAEMQQIHYGSEDESLKAMDKVFKQAGARFENIWLIFGDVPMRQPIDPNIKLAALQVIKYNTVSRNMIVTLALEAGFDTHLQVRRACFETLEGLLSNHVYGAYRAIYSSLPKETDPALLQDKKDFCEWLGVLVKQNKEPIETNNVTKAPAE